MELADYLGRIWRLKWIVLVIAFLAVVLTIMVMYFLPRHYEATSVLEVGGIQSMLIQPGQPRDTSKQTLPSSIQAMTQTYLNILATPQVAEEARNRVIMQLSPTSSKGNEEDGSAESSAGTASGDSADFDYTTRSQAVGGSGTDMIYIDVIADEPDIAKAAADSLALILVEESTNLNEGLADDFVASIEDGEIAAINARLAEIREKAEALKLNAGVDTVTKNVEIAKLNDEALTLENTRRQYTEIIARVKLNEALELNNLRIMSLAATPTARSAPPYVRSGVVAATVGLLIGILSVMFIDRRKSMPVEIV